MTFEIEVDGRARTVSVEGAGQGRYRVVMDGARYLVDAARIGEFGLSLILGDGGVTSREVQIAPAGSRGDLLVALDGRTVPAATNGRRRRRAGADAAADVGEQTVVAPMPGRVVRVLIGPGDHVTARQPMLVVEAMKMENELRSPKAGTVKEVTVSAGMSVEAGRVLVTIG
jgi:biotin carboxyl carrier protein